MNKQSEFWSGMGGDAYTRRNRVDWRARIPFWKTIYEIAGFRSVYEIGCNAGWNLSAIQRVDPMITMGGEDINEHAMRQARQATHRSHAMKEVDEEGYFGVFDLAFTAGVLIHQGPDDVKELMQRVINFSADWVLAIEYADTTVVPVPYRGEPDLLWRRPYGEMYESMGLKLEVSGDAGPGFDRCDYWLLRK